METPDEKVIHIEKEVIDEYAKSAAGQEYLYIKCVKCDERVKLAKNKGADWMISSNPNWFYDFALEHFAYDHKPEDIVLEWQR